MKNPAPGPRRNLVLAAAVIGLLTGLPGCTAPGTPGELPAARQLDQLVVAERPDPDPSYRRAAFGPAWADVDRDGCNTRDQVLYATADKSKPVEFRRQGRCPIDMVAGTWIDLYTNSEMVWTNLKDPAQAQALPLDHIVSLAEAWRDGADTWTADQRLQFANDPLNLQPTTAAINRDKTDHDPATWTPPKPGQCGYATRYITTKARYQLPVDQGEKTALHPSRLWPMKRSCCVPGVRRTSSSSWRHSVTRSSYSTLTGPTSRAEAQRQLLEQEELRVQGGAINFAVVGVVDPGTCLAASL